jgi:hypothetical protein
MKTEYTKKKTVIRLVNVFNLTFKDEWKVTQSFQNGILLDVSSKKGIQQTFNSN